jgi:sulfopyruvate decarboxylase subunit beta
MKTNECMKVLAKHRGDAVVVCALGMAANEWWAVTRSEDSFYMHGGMGFAASFALGLALSIPQTPVWVLNSDGSLCMNTGSLLTEAGQQPRNLKHFVVDNQCYQTVETMPMVNQNGADYTAMARAAGIAQALTIDNLADLDRRMPEIVAAPGPYFIRLRVEAEPDYQRAPPANYEGPEMKYRFGRALEKKLGIKVFGTRGF